MVYESIFINKIKKYFFELVFLEMGQMGLAAAMNRRTSPMLFAAEEGV
jgi:hypothetical protein